MSEFIRLDNGTLDVGAIFHDGTVRTYHGPPEDFPEDFWRPNAERHPMRITSDLTVDLIQHVGGDDAVLDAMLVSTLTDRLAGSDADPGRDAGRINFLMANRHGSPFEHNLMTFRVTAPIAVFREWHRHRIGWSYNEQSGRYTKFEPHFYLPAANRPMVQVGKPGAYEFEPIEQEHYDAIASGMVASFAESWRKYEELLDIGAAKEVARGVLPVYVMSTMYATCNARSLMSFLSLRRKKNLEGGPEPVFPSFPMWEIDECAEQCERLFAELFPLTYQAYIANGRVAP